MKKMYYYKCYYQKTGKIVVVETANKDINLKPYGLSLICETTKRASKKMITVRLEA